MQFNVPFRPNVPSFVYPTKLIDESHEFKLGDKTFELYHARAETDDHCWVHVPEVRTAIVGDLVIGGFPNVGNPWKPTRFALGWVKTLEAIRDKDPELLLGGGGGRIFKGEAVRAVLNDYIEAIYAIHDQVVEYINKDVPVDEMIHQVELPDHLAESPYLRSSYARVEFAVYNIYRWYHGYFDHNPAHLLPRPQKEVNEEIFNLIGGSEAIMSRARELAKGDEEQLGLQVLDVLLQHDPEHVEGRKLRIALLEKLASDDTCLMSRNTWVYFIERDQEFLRAKGNA
jgi:alkyl sulfatase BDS1-like metallo-beta-lactamase superfamily hydrolase